MIKKILGINFEAVMERLVLAARGDSSARKWVVILYGPRSVFKTTLGYWLAMILRITVLTNTGKDVFLDRSGTAGKVEAVRQTIGCDTASWADDVLTTKTHRLLYGKTRDRMNGMITFMSKDLKEPFGDVAVKYLVVATTNALIPDDMIADADTITDDEAKNVILAVKVGAADPEELEQLRAEGMSLVEDLSIHGQYEDWLLRRLEVIKLLASISVGLGDRKTPAAGTSLFDEREQRRSAAAAAAAGGGAEGAGSLRDRFLAYMQARYTVPDGNWKVAPLTDFACFDDVVREWNKVNKASPMDKERFKGIAEEGDRGRAFRVGPFEFRDKLNFTPPGSNSRTSTTNKFYARRCGGPPCMPVSCAIARRSLPG